MIILLSFLISFQAMASASDDRAANLLTAKSVKDLKIKAHVFGEFKKYETKCEFELSNTLVPKSCYQLKLTPAKINVVDQACERASYIMKEEVSIHGLSKICANFVDKKNKDLRYSREETMPEKYIFE